MDVRFSDCSLVCSILLGFTVWHQIAPDSAIAQVIPDGSLGFESSIVVPDVVTENGLLDRIDGGASRGNNLFHSFLEFNVDLGQQLYFANPAAIENIISRVTGSNDSTILGTLGVLGNANLFLINPNGIVLGPESEIDVRGSFVASTAESFVFGNGYAFSTTNPNSPPLLTVDAPLGLATWLPQSGTITSTGLLETGQDVVFVGQNLNLRGQIQAGRDLTLLASADLLATDSPTQPLSLIAGRELILQGNQWLTIDALNHPDSGLFSGQNTTLRSDSPIVGDAFFSSGGDFLAQRLDGSLGSVISPQDPVFETAGDFAIANFSGGSLQILAGGSVTIPGDVTITAAGGPFNDSTVTLSDSTTVSVAGTTVPTLDIRAGTTSFFGTPTGGSPSSADISIGRVGVPGGLVLLTNQYQPDTALAGNISVGDISTADINGGGDVVLDSRGELTFNLIDASGGDISTFDLGGNGGSVKLLATDTLSMPFPSFIFTYGLIGGPITLASNTAIIQADGPLGIDPFDLSIIESLNVGSTDSQPISLTAPDIQLGGNIFTTSLGPGTGGDIFLQGDSLTLNQATIGPATFGPGNSGEIHLTFDTITLEFTSQVGTASFSDSGGAAGDVTLQVGLLSATEGAQVSSLAFGLGDAGDVNITAQAITLSEFAEITGGFFAPSGIFSSTQFGAEGNSGSLNISTDTLAISDAANVGTSSFGMGNAGQVSIDARTAVTVDGAVFPGFAIDNDSQPSGISSEVFAGAVGDGGEIIIDTPVLSVTNGGTITTTTNGDGNAGDITITATESVTFDGVVAFSDLGGQDRISSASVETQAQATGNGGTLTIKTPSLSLTNGARLEALTEGSGNAGNIELHVVQTLALEGRNSGIFADTTTNSTGGGGSIFINLGHPFMDSALDVVVRDGAQVSVASAGTGEAGDVLMNGDTLLLDQGSISAETLSSSGGDINLNIDDVVALTDGSRISTTAGTALAGGDGGNISLATTFLVASPNSGNSDITANAFSGAGGSVMINADGILGLTSLSRAELENLLGTSDPILLDPANLSSNDITAISRENPSLQGQVTITTPDVDPSQSVVSLPANVIDASRLIAQGCASRGAIAQEIGSLVVTGRGGLPDSPIDNLSNRQLLLDWATVESTESTSETPMAETVAVPSERPMAETMEVSSATTPRQIQEVQSLAVDADGRAVLLAQAMENTPPDVWLPRLTCAGAIHEDAL